MSEGTIVTFYSYKGGVGRTFALANVGAALAAWGFRVLCLDWDLDSPGLRQYFKYEELRPGLVELIAAVNPDDYPDWRDYITRVSLPTGVEIDLMLAGQQDDSYIDRVQQLNWAELYEQRGLAQFLEYWRVELKDAYDFILVDSRTGVTDIGALCTANLPDILLAMFTANRQSLDGCIEVVERAIKTRKEIGFERTALLVLPIPSRFDSREEYQLAQQWQSEFENKLKHFYTSWTDESVEVLQVLSRTTIPYMAYWSFGEELPVVQDKIRGTGSVRFFLETIAALVAHRLTNTRLLLDSSERYIEAAISSGRRREGVIHDIFIGFTDDLAETAQEIESTLFSNGISAYRSNFQLPIEPEQEPGKELDQSQHAVFLIGSDYNPQMAAEIRRFTRQAIDADVNRTILPMVFLPNESPSLPGILDRWKVSVAEGTEVEVLANQILQLIRPGQGIPVDVESDPDLDFAISQINDSDSFVREGAVATILRIGGDKEITRLLPMIGDENQRVRRTIRNALQRQIQEGETTIRDITEKLASHSRSAARVELASIIGDFRDTREIKTLIDFLADEFANVREAAASALGNLGDSSATDWLLPRLGDKERRVQVAVFHAINQIGSEIGLRGIQEKLNENILMMRDGDEGTRMDAIKTSSILIGGRASLLLSRDYDGDDPWLDPSEPIDGEHLQKGATKLNLSLDELRVEFEYINARIGGTLVFSW